MSPLVANPLAWKRIEPWLDQALDLAPGERVPWLADLARTEPDIADELTRLLAEVEAADARGFLTTPAWSAMVQSDMAGKRVGAYTVKRLLGRGGMGDVWLASRSDGRFEGYCAIKFLDASVRQHKRAERFRREGLLLARLTHPNIARLIDAGTFEDTRPWLALEYVDGMPIDKYCATHSLSVDQRVRLFIDVVSAVAHAHSHLIVHRDLKPTNVLVTDSGVVKLLDFGIARLMSAEPEEGGETPTRLEDAALTPEYAAPEQLAGEVPSTATDVYQLGMLLYVLLAGKHPWYEATGTRTERMKAALEGLVPRASDQAEGALRKKLRGDLDAILAMALRPNPRERYASAEALREELSRYLNGEPVRARRGATLYQTRKFVGRHRVGVLTSCLAVAGLVAAVIYATGQARLARDEARHAQDISSFILSIFQAARPGGGGGTDLRVVELLVQTIPRIEHELADQPARQIELYTSVAEALCELNAHHEAMAAFDRARDVAARSGLEDSDVDLNAQLATVETLIALDELPRAEALLRKVDTTLSQRTPGTLHARALGEHSYLALNQRQPKQAVTAAIASASMYRTLAGENSTDYLSALLDQVRAQYHADDCAHALPTLDATLRRLPRVVGGEEHPTIMRFRGVRARCLTDLGRPDEAATEFERNDAAVRAAFGTESKDYAIEQMERASTERARGNPDAALKLIDNAIRIYEARGLVGYNLVTARRQAALALIQGRRLSEAAVRARDWRAAAQAAYEPNDRFNLEASFYIAALDVLNDSRAQRAEVQAVLADMDQRAAATDGAVRASMQNVLGWLRLLNGDPNGALQEFTAATPAFVDLGILGVRLLTFARIYSGAAQLELGHVAEARTLLEGALEEHPKLYSSDTPERADLWRFAARLKMKLGAVAEARQFARQADEFWAQRDPQSRWATEAAYWRGRTNASGRQDLATLDHQSNAADRVNVSAGVAGDGNQIRRHANAD